jgi:hypothetical protein
MIVHGVYPRRKLLPADTCLYYDIGKANVPLGRDMSKYKNVGVERTDWIGWWRGSVMEMCQGRCSTPLYFVGNIATCNAKGMRLPTIHEVEADINDPTFGAKYYPKMNIDVDKMIAQGGAKYPPVGQGVPAVPGPGWTYTASAAWQNMFPYTYFIFNGKRHIEKSTFDKPQNVRCVLPP